MMWCIRFINHVIILITSQAQARDVVKRLGQAAAAVSQVVVVNLHVWRRDVVLIVNMHQSTTTAAVALVYNNNNVWLVCCCSWGFNSCVVFIWPTLIWTTVLYKSHCLLDVSFFGMFEGFPWRKTSAKWASVKWSHTVVCSRCWLLVALHLHTNKVSVL